MRHFHYSLICLDKSKLWQQTPLFEIHPIICKSVFTILLEKWHCVLWDCGFTLISWRILALSKLFDIKDRRGELNNLLQLKHDPLKNCFKPVSETVLSSLHWLLAKTMIDFKIFLSYQGLHVQGPTDLKELLVPYNPSRELHSQQAGSLGIPRIFKSTSYKVPQLWNHRLASVWKADTLCTFRSRLEMFLFRRLRLLSRAAGILLRLLSLHWAPLCSSCLTSDLLSILFVPQLARVTDLTTFQESLCVYCLTGFLRIITSFPWIFSGPTTVFSTL